MIHWIGIIAIKWTWTAPGHICGIEMPYWWVELQISLWPFLPYNFTMHQDGFTGILISCTLFHPIIVQLLSYMYVRFSNDVFYRLCTEAQDWLVEPVRKLNWICQKGSTGWSLGVHLHNKCHIDIWYTVVLNRKPTPTQALLKQEMKSHVDRMLHGNQN